MRFDKNIWDPTCREYNSATELDTSYFTEPAKVFVSVWLERLADFNAPVTRRLDRLCLLDIADELLRAISLWQTNDKTAYRVLVLLREMERSLQDSSTAVTLPGRPEADRLQAVIPKFAEFIRAPNKERDKLWPAIAAALGRGAELNGGHPDAREMFTREVVALATAFRAFLRGDGAYLRALTVAVADSLDGAVDLGRIDHVVCELLAYSLRRGYSREQLGELPIKYLRADNTRFGDTSFKDRVSLMLGAFKPSKQRYLVVLPLTGPTLAIDGDIFPSGIEVVQSGSWNNEIPDGVLRELKPEDAARQAFRVDVDEVLDYESADGLARPHDMFAARDLAVRIVRRCLDAVFLLRAAVPSLAGFALVSAVELEKDPFVKRIELERDHRPDKVSLKFLRAVPAEWVDALHWYREGREDPSDEVGLVNLWTAVELLSRRDGGSYHSDAERVQRTVGALATLSLMEREIRYLGREVATCLGVHADDHHEVFRSWVKDKSDDETRAALARFPHLAEVVCSARAGNYFATRFNQVQLLVADKLVWAYGYRNDVVHEGRRGLPAASTARTVLAEIAEAAISLTLKLESRRFASSLHECFHWARAQQMTLADLSATGTPETFLARLDP